MVATVLETAAFVVALAVIVQRERVLRRRVRRMEIRFRMHQSLSHADRHVHVVSGTPSPAHPVWQPSPPTVEQLAALARPLSRAGG